MSKEDKVQALVLIARELMEEQTKLEKKYALKENKEKQLTQELEYKNQVIEKYQKNLLHAKS